MKSSNEVWLGLEVLEDRVALSGAFGGAFNAGPPTLALFNSLTANATNISPSVPGFRGSSADFNSVHLVQVPTFQSQLQAFQAAQIAMIDLYFSELGSMLQLLHLNNP